MSSPKLTKVFKINEAWPQDNLDIKDNQSSMPKHDPERAKAQSAAKSSGKKFQALQGRRAKRDQEKGKNQRMTQQDLPGMDKVFSQKPDRKADWPEQSDGRKPLDQVKGKFMHVDQHSGLSPHLIQKTGYKYGTLPSNLMKGVVIDGNKGARWGSGTFKIGDDGTLELVDSNWDSSG